MFFLGGLTHLPISGTKVTTNFGRLIDVQGYYFFVNI